MNTSHLNWSSFNWDDFQILSIRIAENQIPDCDFESFLKHGHKQDGIDLLSFNKKDGSFITVQCKRVKNFTPSDLQEVITSFSGGEFRDKSSRFILCVSSDLQSKKMQNSIIKLKTDLRSEYNIAFDCWDLSFIELHLKNYWSIVSYYFGKEVADNFCYPQFWDTSFGNLSPIPDYIPRKIYPLNENTYQGNDGWNFATKQLFELYEILVNNPLNTLKICVIGDAYQGKSSYLRQVAYLLKIAGLHIQPLLIDIKDYSIQPLETLLNTIFGSWKNIPIKDLVVIIDGLDEAPTDKFDELVRYINEFSISYSSCTIIISCRKIFFNHYSVGKILKKFSFYNLQPLQEADIHFYLDNALGNLKNKFVRAVENAQIYSLLFHPFYLINLVQDFNRPPHQILNNKIKLIDQFITRAFEQSYSRRIQGGQSLKHKSLRFKKNIQKLALSFQIAGVNAFGSEEIQEMFPASEDIELLQHGSFLSVSKTYWSFSNALFQEHLAALALSSLQYDQIIQLASVGSHFKKVKTKWIQTLSSLISLLENNDTLYQQLLHFLENDNVELIFQTENKKYTAAFKLTVLKALINKCIATNTRPTIIYEETIGTFIDGASSATDYLLEVINDGSISERVKIISCRILRNTALNSTQKAKFLYVSFEEIRRSNDSMYAGNLVAVLAAHAIGDKTTISELLSETIHNEYHFYREYVYELILVLGLHEDFYEYGLIGVSYLIKYNSTISHGGSERRLEELLLATNNRKNISLLFITMQEKEWLEFYRFRNRGDDGFLGRLCKKCIEIFLTDPLIFFPVAQYTKAIGKAYLRDEFNEIEQFFEKTKSYNLIVRFLIKDIFEDNDWEFGAWITPELYDYIFFEFESNNYEISTLRGCFAGLRQKNKEEIANQFYNQCIDITEGTINSDNSKWGDYQKTELVKRKNDLKYIKSAKSFRQGIIKYFEAYGKKIIPEDDLYVDLDDRPSRAKSDSYLIFNYLLGWIRSNKTVYLKECLAFLDNKEKFEEMRVDEILIYNYQTPESDAILNPILKKYYDSKLPTANFVNSLWIKGDRFQWLILEKRLGEIFKKIQFPTSDQHLIQMVWLDTGGINNFENNTLNKTQSISQLILKNLSPKGLDQFKKAIVENLEKGIKLEGVLGNHLGLCKHLKIYEAKGSILKIIQISKFQELYMPHIVDIYLELGGDYSELLKEFYKINSGYDTYYLHLVKHLSSHYPKIIQTSLLQALNNPDTAEQYKIRIAIELAQTGLIDGLTYLAGLISRDKKSPYNIQTGYKIYNVDTVLGLNELSGLVYFLVDEKYYNEREFHNTARHIILEWLDGFASKSESDLELVVTFLSNQQSKLKTEYGDISDLTWYINRMIENFRNSDKSTKGIGEVITILSSLSI